jgi:serine protease Do
MSVEDISEADRKKLELKQGGVVVTNVKPGPAANAGIRPGDIILMLNNEDVENSADFAKRIKELPKGKPTAVLVQRGDSPLFLSLTIPDKK